MRRYGVVGSGDGGGGHADLSAERCSATRASNGGATAMMTAPTTAAVVDGVGEGREGGRGRQRQ
eukprot:6910631-Pyramimonas_sp.AAC.1